MILWRNWSETEQILDLDDGILVWRNVGNSANVRYGNMEDSTRNKTRKIAENPSWLWSLLACCLGTVRTVRLFSLADHSWCPRPPPLSCPSVGSCSLLACHFDRSPAIEALLACRTRPNPPLPLPTLSAHLLATFGFLFALAWATCLKLSHIRRRTEPARRVPRLWIRIRSCRRSFLRPTFGYARVLFGTVLFVGTGREKLNFSRHSSGRSWWGHPGSR